MKSRRSAGNFRGFGMDLSRKETTGKDHAGHSPHFSVRWPFDGFFYQARRIHQIRGGKSKSPCQAHCFCRCKRLTRDSRLLWFWHSFQVTMGDRKTGYRLSFVLGPLAVLTSHPKPGSSAWMCNPLGLMPSVEVLAMFYILPFAEMICFFPGWF